MLAPLTVANEDPDARLMERVRDGESELFGELVLRHQSRVAGLIARMQPHGGDVDDLTQRVFVQAFSARKSYRPTAKFTTWLFVITKNVILNERRTLARRRAVMMRGSSQGHTGSPTTSDHPIDDAIRAESQDQVRQAIDMLCHRQKRVMQLVFLKGYRYRAAGEELDLTEKAVKSLVHRAKGNLRTQLRRYVRAAD